MRNKREIKTEIFFIENEVEEMVYNLLNGASDDEIYVQISLIEDYLNTVKSLLKLKEKRNVAEYEREIANNFLLVTLTQFIQNTMIANDCK